MTVIAIRKDAQSRTMTLEAEFDASPERVWQLRADPRQLERWWGPPTYPATVDAHDLRSGARVEYHMTGPDGDQPRGSWEVDEVQAPHRLVFRDGVANEDGTPNTELPLTTARVTIREIGAGKTRMSIESEFPTVEAMEQLAAMGMDEGLTQAIGQIGLDPGRGSGRGSCWPAMTAVSFDSSISDGYIAQLPHAPSTHASVGFPRRLPGPELAGVPTRRLISFRIG